MSLADLYNQSAFSPTGTHSLYCQYCDKTFRSFSSYSSHMEKEHHIKKGKLKPKASAVPEWDDKKDICDGRTCGLCVIL